ncbi:hypothetical protein IV203_029160 [Nitzschia inconspicua]|uniref:Uncharacterized protein n=1 Tax=Nitzschia inconspicua TaxID=303405 RepID=A0A9K3Q0Z1_9STRA|nr:hypothetical protein IV203_029160 [Nitzschia inconspicua]
MSKKRGSRISNECLSNTQQITASPVVRVEPRPPVSIAAASFRVLCTATRRKINWGSYELRCRDLAEWARRCAKNVFIQNGVSFEDFERLRWFRSMMGELSDEEKVSYDASVFVKSYPNSSLPLYGKMFMDVVDEYWVPDEEVPGYVELILQTNWQGEDFFPSHNYSVVEHWYNSYPADMALAGDPIEVPSITEKSKIKIATVWNTRRSHDPSEGGCPNVSTTNVSYHCLDKEFDISKWYAKVMKGPDSQCEMERTLANPELGPGKLYYDIFRKYDALVVLAKNHTMKLKYGNVQRAISQMRSGVPVLVEIRGKVLEDFIQRYNYTCAFRRYRERGSISDKLWSFDEAVEKLKDVNVRRECQQQGLEIIKDYSPSKIGQKFLRTLGYDGDFSC